MVVVVGCFNEFVYFMYSIFCGAEQQQSRSRAAAEPQQNTCRANSIIVLLQQQLQLVVQGDFVYLGHWIKEELGRCAASERGERGEQRKRARERESEND